MSEEKTNADVAALPFEAAMKELEGIVARLERGDVPLEESIAIYTRGEALKARCDALLKQARQLDTAIHLNEWASSPGLRPPKS